MMSIFKVPAGMSYVNAFYALWEKSEHILYYLKHPEFKNEAAEKVSTAEKIANIFKDHNVFEYEGGKAIKADFSKFPMIDATLYDKIFGLGSAQKVIENYSKIPSERRFDKNDTFK